MSRTIFALCVLGLLSGCQSLSLPGRASTNSVRLQTISNCDSCNGDSCNSGCRDCIPHRVPGCWYHYGLDCHLTTFTARHCGYRALRAYRKECGRVPSCHFRRGFLQAYEDLGMNRRPSPPVMPPPKYWNAYYRSCAGKPDVEDWFAGYEAGLERGSNAGVSQFHEIYLNRCGLGSSNQAGYGQGFRQFSSQPQANPAPVSSVQDLNYYGNPGQQNVDPGRSNNYWGPQNGSPAMQYGVFAQ